LLHDIIVAPPLRTPLVDSTDIDVDIDADIDADIDT
jgi:hypothetical protein